MAPGSVRGGLLFGLAVLLAVSSVSSTNICLNIIVRDAASQLPSSLEAIKEHISGYVACDTGSSDETQAVLKEQLAGLPGTILQHTWKDFGHNRNLCLEAAEAWSEENGGACEYLFFMDADQASHV